MSRINIITRYNQNGLGRDAQLVATVLSQAGFTVNIDEVGKSSFDHKLYRIQDNFQRFICDKITGVPPYHINIFIEDVMPPYLPYARVNCLIPNPEWFRDGWRSFLPKFDYILCKTRQGQAIFNQLGCRTEFISFTSFNRFNSSMVKGDNSFLHLAGANPQKGTQAILTLWQQHPEWPEIVVIQNRRGVEKVVAPNIKQITNFVPDDALIQLQNQAGVHLCPSEVEGFGHSLVEGMSSQALVLTTDAPPMNEIITAERGILVKASHQEKQSLGVRYFVGLQHLETQIETILGMESSQRRQLGKQAQEWYRQNDQFFREKLVEFIRQI